MAENPYVKKEGDQDVITDEGLAYLSRIVTDPVGQVYACTKDASPMSVAAAMARLSRSSDDMRLIFLKEFALAEEERAETLFNNVLTQYGDDSVAQLMFLQIVVERASNILTKMLEWSRLGAYLETSTRYIFFDKRDENGKYRHYIPTTFPAHLCAVYEQYMEELFDLYSSMVRGVTDYLRRRIPVPADKLKRSAWMSSTRAQACDAARAVLPVATMSTVGIVASAQTVENLILHLASQELEECQRVARDILREARKVAAPFFKRTDMPERGGATVAYKMQKREAIKKIVAIRLPKTSRHEERPIEYPSVALLDYWPEDECDLVPEMLFAESHLSLNELAWEVAEWNKEQKEEVFHAYIGERFNRRHKPGRAVEKTHYQWEITADYGTYRDLQRHRMVDEWEWQCLTPYYGYDVPMLVKDAGFEAQFHRCFELSQTLFEAIKKAGFEKEAQYATLLGHRMRYRFIINATEAFHMLELRTQPQGHPGYRKICLEMHRLLCEAHPLLGAAMRFVNKEEDPELTRMAAEMTKEKKLALLSD